MSCTFRVFASSSKTQFERLNQYVIILVVKPKRRQFVWTKWSDLCFKKPASCLYGESWKREFYAVEWLQSFLGHLSKMLLIPFSSPPPHHPSNGSLFRAPSNTVTTVTVHKQVGGAKRFGNGKCGRASHSASISSLSSSLFGTFATLKLTWHFFLNCGWVDAVYWHTYFLACRRACSSTKCSPEAACASDTDWDMNSFAHLSEIVGLPFINLFYFIRQCTLILFFFYPVSRCLNLEWFDWLIDWLGWFIWVHFFGCFLII